MATSRIAPSGLGTKGRSLWKDLHSVQGVKFNPAEEVLIEEACRIADRLDRLDEILSSSDGAWLRFRVSDDGAEVTVTVDGALSEARQQANVLKQLFAALRLPEEMAGARPQHRGGARGAYKPAGNAGAGSNVTSLDRARQARGG